VARLFFEDERTPRRSGGFVCSLQGQTHIEARGEGEARRTRGMARLTRRNLYYWAAGPASQRRAQGLTKAGESADGCGGQPNVIVESGLALPEQYRF
jgi:hypothetical protein